ncbi:hypothetical protein TcCL_NonESM07654 [Trypanosoma cruzi]|nr:hypothetical protein TcCL_NonESM07654 [Trypanosoma cruzi]
MPRPSGINSIFALSLQCTACGLGEEGLRVILAEELSARSAGLLGKGDATVDEEEAWRSQRCPSSPPNRVVSTPWRPSVALSRGKLLASSFLQRRRGRWWWP